MTVRVDRGACFLVYGLGNNGLEWPFCVSVVLVGVGGLSGLGVMLVFSSIVPSGERSMLAPRGKIFGTVMWSFFVFGEIAGEVSMESLSLVIVLGTEFVRMVGS